MDGAVWRHEATISWCYIASYLLKFRGLTYTELSS